MVNERRVKEMLDKYFKRLVCDEPEGKVVAQCRLCKRICSYKKTHLARRHIQAYNKIYRNPTAPGATTAAAVPSTTATTITTNGEGHSIINSGPSDLRIKSLIRPAIGSVQLFPNGTRRSAISSGSSNMRSRSFLRPANRSPVGTARPFRPRRSLINSGTTSFWRKSFLRPTFSSVSLFHPARRSAISRSDLRPANLSGGTPSQLTNGAKVSPIAVNSSSNRTVSYNLRPANTSAIGSPPQFTNGANLSSTTSSSCNRIVSNLRPTNTLAFGTPEQLANIARRLSLNSTSSSNRIASEMHPANISAIVTPQPAANSASSSNRISWNLRPTNTSVFGTPEQLANIARRLSLNSTSSSNRIASEMHPANRSAIVTPQPAANSASSSNRISWNLRPTNTSAISTPQPVVNSDSSSNKIGSNIRPANTSSLDARQRFAKGARRLSMNSTSSSNRIVSNFREAITSSTGTPQRLTNRLSAESQQQPFETNTASPIANFRLTSTSSHTAGPSGNCTNRPLQTLRSRVSTAQEEIGRSGSNITDSSIETRPSLKASKQKAKVQQVRELKNDEVTSSTGNMSNKSPSVSSEISSSPLPSLNHKNRTTTANSHASPRSTESERSLLTNMILDLQSFFLDDGSSLTTLEPHLFPSEKTPSEHQLRDLLHTTFKTAEQRLREKLENVKFISLTISKCQSKEKTYRAVTAHYLDGNWELQQAFLGYFECYDNSKMNYVKLKLEEIIEGWRIEAKIVACVTSHDDGTVRNAMARYTKTALTCFAHGVHLCVCDSFPPELQAIIEKVEYIVTYFQQNLNASQDLNNSQETRIGTKSPLLDNCSSWWIGTLNMIERATDLKDDVLNVVARINLSGEYELTHSEWATLDTIVKILKPLSNFTAKLFKKDEVMISQVAKAVSLIKDELLVYLPQKWKQPRDYTISENLVSKLVLNLDELFPDIGISGEASLLDPRMKNDFTLLNVASYRTAGMADIFSYLGEPPLPLQGNPWAWWNSNTDRYPRLAQLAKQYLSVPVVSTPQEDVFQEGNVQSINLEPKPSMSIRDHENIVFLNKNYRLWSI